MTACQCSQVTVNLVACHHSHCIMASRPSAKRKRKDFTASEKVQIIEYKKENPNASVRTIAEKFVCGKSQIQSILAKGNEILEDYSANKNAHSKRARVSPMKNVDEATYEWYQKARTKNIPVTGPMLQEKAKRASEELGDSTFKASNGWLDRFKKRYNITSKVISGEAGGVSEETVSSWKERLPSILSGYSPENVLNMDETGQFFRALPNRSLTEVSKQCIGGKKSKERITCAFFVNAAGHCEKPIVIGKSKSPRCFKAIRDTSQLPCSYFSQPKAWMDFNILDDVLSKLNRKLARENRNVILFLDNAPCHPPDMKGKYDHIKIVFFPPNCTSRLQPLDLGIIQTIKHKYMKLMLTHVVSKIDDCDSATEVCKSVDLLQAIRWIGQAWETVSESTIKKCFVKAGFLSADESLVSFPAEHREFDPFEELESGELAQVNSLLCDASSGSSSDIPSAVEALEATSALPTCKELSANWEEEFFSDLSASSSQDPGQDKDSDDDLIEVNSQAKEVKVKSMREAMTMLEDLTEYLTTENLTETANSLAKVLSHLQSAWLYRKLKTSVQSKVTDFLK